MLIEEKNIKKYLFSKLTNIFFQKFQFDKEF